MKEDKNFKLMLVIEGKLISETNIINSFRSNEDYFKTKVKNKPIINARPIFNKLKGGDLLIKIAPNNKFARTGFAFVINRSKDYVTIYLGWGFETITQKEEIALANYLTIKNQNNVRLKTNI